MKRWPRGLVKRYSFDYQLFIPWLWGSLFSLLALGVLLVLDRMLPELLDSLLGLTDSNYHGIFPFGMSNPFGGIRMIFLGTAVLVYVSSGLFFYFVRRRKPESIKIGLGKMWLFTALGSLFLAIPILAALWALAWKFGAVNLALHWQSSYGNHGPWRHFYDLRSIVQIMWLVHICSSLVSIAGLASRAIRSVAALVAANLAILYLLFNRHWWLID